jgi:hypothetical protein
MKRLLHIVNPVEGTNYTDELHVDDYTMDSMVRVSVEDDYRYTSIDLNVSQVKDLIKVLQAWVIQ